MLQNEMPFKIGAYYFEAVQCVKKVENHHIENRLARCINTPVKPTTLKSVALSVNMQRLIMRHR